MIIPEECEYCGIGLSQNGEFNTYWRASSMRAERIIRLPLAVGVYHPSHLLCSSCSRAIDELHNFSSKLDIKNSHM